MANHYPWDILPELLRMGMRVVAVRQGAGAETIMIVEMPEGMMSEKTKRQAKLATMLETMLRQLKPGVPGRLALAGGMNIDVVFGLDGVFRMQVWREGKYPSDVEWETTLKNLPYEVDGEPEERFEVKGRCYLRRGWGVLQLTLKEKL